MASRPADGPHDVACHPASTSAPSAPTDSPCPYVRAPRTAAAGDRGSASVTARFRVARLGDKALRNLEGARG